MQPTFRQRATRASLVESAGRSLRAQLIQDGLASVEANRLRNLNEDSPRAGSKPLVVLEDDAGRRFALKLAPPSLVAAEETAYALRHLGGRPVIPARAIELNLEGIGQVEGLLKPFVDFDPERTLPTDTRLWSELQRSVLLMEHAWEWFLDNLDTNPSQYALIGPWDYPLNIDWDRSFASDGQSELSRFAKYKPTLPNARTFLYADFVERRVKLKFALLMSEARRIRRLPVRKVRAIVELYARRTYDDEVTRNRFCSRVLDRQQRIESECARFIGELKRERRELARASKAPLGPRARAALAQAWNGWQVVLDAVLRSAIGRAGRSALRISRAGWGSRAEY